MRDWMASVSVVPHQTLVASSVVPVALPLASSMVLAGLISVLYSMVAAPNTSMVVDVVVMAPPAATLPSTQLYLKSRPGACPPVEFTSVTSAPVVVELPWMRLPSMDGVETTLTYNPPPWLPLTVLLETDLSVGA